MKIAVIGSQGLQVSIEQYIPQNTSMIISNGSGNISHAAMKYADTHHLPAEIIAPDACNGRSAWLIQHRAIVNRADMLVAIWDGHSRNTKYAIHYAIKQGKPVLAISL